MMKIEHVSEREFTRWFGRLGPTERAKVDWELTVLLRMGRDLGMPYVRELGEGLMELRIRSGQQPRLYFRFRDDTVEFLTYGRKDTQDRDIQRARRRMT